MELDERLFNMLITTIVLLFISSIILAALQRYIAAIFALISGIILISFVSELQSEEK